MSSVEARAAASAPTPPSKSVRILTRRTATVIEREVAPTPTPTQVALAPIPSVAPAATPVASDSSLEQVAFSRAGYLPRGGPLPLRFTPARGWPPPLPDAAVEILSAARSSPTAAPADSLQDAEAPTSLDASGAAVATVQASEVSNDDEAADTQRTITADMILGYLGNIPVERDRLRVRFEPAIPEDVFPANSSFHTP